MSTDDLLENATPKNPDLELAQIKFVLTMPEYEEDKELKDKLLDGIKENAMAPWYEEICLTLHWKLNKALLSTMKMQNDEEFKVLDEGIAEAEKSLNDIEVRDAHLKKAEYLSRIGDHSNALVALEITYEKTVPLSHRIEILFHCVRIGLFSMNHKVITSNLEKAEKLIEEGGNWDLRNKLKVYKGLYLLSIREFKEAIDLFLDTISTFTSYEILDYNAFVKYTVLIGMVALPRKFLNEKIIRAPEIQTGLHSDKDLKNYVYSLYNCQYSEFILLLADVEQELKKDWFLNPHYRYYVREMKIKAYSQLLESYRSLSLEFMAKSFGVTADYIDDDLSRFISAGRLTCKIDKVGGIVETNRTDQKGVQYQDVIKHGDLLLNRVQKLSRGICPGNRLRLIPGMYTDICSREPSPCGPPMTELSGDLNTLQRQGMRRSWHVQPNKVLTPKKYNDVYLYDTPSRCSPVSCNSPRDSGGDSYDVPPRAVPITYDTPRSFSGCSPAPSSISPIRRDSSGDSYDVPRPVHHCQQPLTPSSSASSLTTADSLSSSNRSSVVNMPDYDIPRPRGPMLHLHPSHAQQLQQHQQHYQQQQHQQLYDVPPLNPQLKELPLELDSALDSLTKLETDLTIAISRILGYVIPQWRRRDKLETNLMDIKLAVVRLKTSLHDLTEFGEGALGNAARAPDKGLTIKLRPLVGALRNADKLVQETAHVLDQQNWSLDLLVLADDHDTNSSSIHRPDALEQLVACSRALTDDVRQITSFIKGNSTLLFKRASTPQANNNNGELIEDYDYVNLESREQVAKNHADIRDALPPELIKGYDTLIKNAESAAINSDTNKANELNADDKQVLTFYAAQAVTHHNYLTHAIDAFLQTVEHNQPPKVFLAHDKFVVLSAHKLVHIGDTVHRNVTKADIRTRMLNCANALSDALATSVAKTKHAALQFPSVTAVQEMVDSVVDISHLAREIKLTLVQAAQPQ